MTWTGHSPETQIEQQELSEFIRKLSYLPLLRNHLPPSTKNLTALHQSPVNIQVYQIHQLSEETYVIGQEEEGNFAGLKTELAVV